MTESHAGWADQPGFWLVRVGAAATAVFAIAQVSAAAVAIKALLAVAVVIALVLFVVGAAVYLWGFFVAVGRSRTEEVDLPALFLLADAPAPIRRALAIEFAVQLVVAFGTAFARPFSSLAFGILVPLFGGALACLWAARYGDFPPRGKSRREWRDLQPDDDDGRASEPSAPRRRWFDPIDLDDE